MTLPTFVEGVRSLYRTHMAKGLYGHDAVPFVYYRGESLGRDRRDDPELDSFADEVLLDSDADKAKISECGHERGRWKGVGRTRLTTVRDRDATACMSIKVRA